MLKSEAEQMIRRTLEESGGAEMTDEQVALMAQIIMKIAGRMIEEAFSSSAQRQNSGGKPNFFTS